MEGCSAPLVVKFADTQKEKEQKKIHQMQASLLSTINGSAAVGVPTSPVANGLSAIVNGSLGTATTPTGATVGLPSGVSQSNSLAQNATSLTSSTSLITNPPQPMNPFIGADAITTSSLQLLHQMQAVGLQQQFLQGLIYLTFLILLCVFSIFGIDHFCFNHTHLAVIHGSRAQLNTRAYRDRYCSIIHLCNCYYLLFFFNVCVSVCACVNIFFPFRGMRNMQI